MFDEKNIEKLMEYINTIVNYYKWIVSICAIILGFSLTIIPKVAEMEYKFFLGFGWILMLVCIISNFILVKSMMSLYTIACFNDNEEVTNNKITDLFLSNLENRWKVYGNIQNICLLLGIVSLSIFLVANLI